MTFRDDRQRAVVCRTLLAQAGLAELWDERGPNVGAQRRLQHNGIRLPRDSTTLLLTCWAIWDGTGIAAVSDLLSLARAPLSAIGELLEAMSRGPGDVDAWLARWDPGRALVA
jgi:hypothetical protein